MSFVTGGGEKKYVGGGGGGFDKFIQIISVGFINHFQFQILLYSPSELNIGKH